MLDIGSGVADLLSHYTLAALVKDGIQNCFLLEPINIIGSLGSLEACFVCFNNVASSAHSAHVRVVGVHLLKQVLLLADHLILPLFLLLLQLIPQSLLVHPHASWEGGDSAAVS